jgi:hypothetical protein
MLWLPGESSRGWQFWALAGILDAQVNPHGKKEDVLMKIWRSYGSGHSAHLAVVGKFKNVADAQLAQEVIDDWVNALWKERYSDLREFLDAWKERIGAIEFLGPRSSDMMGGLQDECDVVRDGTTVSVTRISSNEIGGIIQLMLLKDAEPVTVTGRTGP